MRRRLHFLAAVWGGALCGLFSGNAHAWSVAVTEASVNSIPELCREKAETFLLRGDYDSEQVGSRLWNIAKIMHSRKHSTELGPEQSSCLEKIRVQALQDEADYWRHIGKKYGCLTETGDVPEEKPESCKTEKWEAVSANLHYLVVSDSLAHLTSAPKSSSAEDCPTQNDTPLNPRTVDTIAQSHVANGLLLQQTQEKREPVATEMNSGLTYEQIFKAAEQNACLQSVAGNQCKLQPQFQTEDFKKKNTCGSGILDSGGIKCAEGIVQGLLGNLKDTVTGTWNFVWGAAKGIVSTDLKYLRILYNGGVGAVARQLKTDGASLINKLLQFVSSIPQLIMTNIVTQSQEFACLNTQAKWEKGCKMASYVAVDAVLLFSGMPGAALEKLGAALSKLPVMEKAVEAVKLGTKGALEAAKIAGRASFEGLGKIHWVQDASSGVKVAIRDAKVFVKEKTGKISEVVEPKAKALLTNAFEKAARVRKATAPMVNSVTERGKTVWKKYISPSERKKRKIEKETAKLPEDFQPDPPILQSKVTELQDDAKAAFHDAVMKQGRQSADLVGLEVRGGGANVQYALSNEGTERVFEHVQDARGNWWFRSETRPAPAMDQAKFPVYLPLDADKISKALPDILNQGDKLGAYAYRLGGSGLTLTSGERVAVYFDSSKKAKKFADKMAAIIDRRNMRNRSHNLVGQTRRIVKVGVIRPVKLGGRVVKMTAKSIAAAAIEKCGFARDPACFCGFYLDAGINPQDGQPVEVSPFNCDRPGQIFPNLPPGQPAEGTGPDRAPVPDDDQ